MQKTRVFFIYKNISNLILGFLKSSWKEKSVSLISIFSGYFLFTNLITNYLSKFNNKVVVVPILIIIFEIIIRVKPRLNTNLYFYWSIFDKIRIGGIYALILEAFKLGS
tara:strand:- start:3868 stop:4194 length:327 start_codon:yes stop_codon:yes gene_type:complete